MTDKIKKTPCIWVFASLSEFILALYFFSNAVLMLFQLLTARCWKVTWNLDTIQSGSRPSVYSR